MKLKNQVALIIGSGRGIGETIAHTFSQEGASVVLVDLEKMKPQLDGIAQAIGILARRLEDMKRQSLRALGADAGQLLELFHQAGERFG